MKIFFKAVLLFSVLVALVAACNSPTKKDTPKTSLLETPPFKSITDSIARFPGNVALYMERAILLSQNNFHEQATADYKKVWELHPEETTAVQYASNLNIINRTDDAIHVVLDALKQFPEGRELKRVLGEYYVQNGKSKEALQLYDTLLNTNPSDFEAWYEKGMLLARLKDTAAAIRALQHACDIQPVVTYALELAHLYAETKNAAALRLCNTIISRDSARDLVDPFFIKGIYYANTAQDEPAVAQFDSCIHRDWKFTEAYIEKGIIFYKQKNYDVAMNTFRLAATVSNSDPDAYYWMGRCYEVIGKKDDAIEFYQKAVALDRNFTEARAAIKRLSP